MKFSGQALSRARGEARVTQEELAQRAGLSLFTISRLERDVNKPEFDTIVKLADALGVDFHALTEPNGNGGTA